MEKKIKRTSQKKESRQRESHLTNLLLTGQKVADALTTIEDIEAKMSFLLKEVDN